MMRLAVFSMAALAVAVTAQIPGYTLTDIVWEVDPWNNGTLLNITGPVQHVYEVLDQINPALVKGVNTSLDGPHTLVQDSADRIVCDKTSIQPANVLVILDGVNYLKGVPGKPAQGPGPGSCGRVSCSYNSAIYWCNDSTKTKVLDSFGQIGDSAQSLCLGCLVNANPGNPNDATCKGTNYMDGQWSSWVAGEPC